MTLAETRRTAADVVGQDGYIRIGEDGFLWIEELRVDTLVEEHGTPLFATSEAQLRRNVRALRQAFADRWPDVGLLFATKANANLAIRCILTEEEVGGDCFGFGELELSLRGGVLPTNLVMNGSNKQPDELTAAVERGILINVDHPDELAQVSAIAAGLGRRAQIALRVLPFSFAEPRHLLADELREIASDRSHDKWGMDRSTLYDIVPEALRDKHLHLRGLHLHVSRIIPTELHFALASTLIAECIEDLGERYGWTPELLDFGGGYAHERDPESGMPAGSHAVATPEQYAEAVTRPLRRVFEERRLALPRLLLEPGRRLVSNTTVLLTRVGVVKHLPNSNDTWLNVDASTNHCLRVPLQHYYYEIVHATRGLAPPTNVVNVVGPTCVIDMIGAERPLPPTHRGDILAVLDVGGYAEVLANQFNLVPRPATVLVTGASATVIRRRESIDDLLATQVVPEHLAGAVA